MCNNNIKDASTVLRMNYPRTRILTYSVEHLAVGKENDMLTYLIIIIFVHKKSLLMGYALAKTKMNLKLSMENATPRRLLLVFLLYVGVLAKVELI